MELFTQIVGWAGTLFVVVAFFLEEIEKINAESKFYQLLNFFGAIGIGVNVFYHGAWPAFALQVVWGIIAVFSLMRLELKTIFVKKK